jgi:hypothetical protein
MLMKRSDDAVYMPDPPYHNDSLTRNSDKQEFTPNFQTELRHEVGDCGGRNDRGKGRGMGKWDKFYFGRRKLINMGAGRGGKPNYERVLPLSPGVIFGREPSKLRK